LVILLVGLSDATLLWNRHRPMALRTTSKLPCVDYADQTAANALMQFRAVPRLLSWRRGGRRARGAAIHAEIPARAIARPTATRCSRPASDLAPPGLAGIGQMIMDRSDAADGDDSRFPHASGHSVIVRRLSDATHERAGPTGTVLGRSHHRLPTCST
jgi:hypothetical protein